MGEVAGAVIATSLVLIAVFVPVAFLSGTTGRLYRQFSLTIAFSVAISAFNALTLSPALAALLMRAAPPRASERRRFVAVPLVQPRLRRHRASATGARSAGSCATSAGPAPAFVGRPGADRCWSSARVPTGFVPDEDQNYFIIQVHRARRARRSTT